MHTMRIIILAVFILTAVILSIVHYKKMKLKIEHIYLVCGLMFGIMYLFVIPPYAAPDEELHINSAYHFSNMLLFDTADNEKTFLLSATTFIDTEMNVRECDAGKSYSQQVSAENYDIYLNSFGEKTGSVNSVAATKRITGPVILYAVSGAGFALARIFHLNYAWVVLFGGIFNVILFVAGVYYSLKILPFGKKCLFVIALSPMVLQQTSSISYDNIIITASIVLAAITVSYAYDKKTDRLRIVIYSLSSFFLLFAKSGTYFLLVLLPFVVGMKRERISKKYMLALAGVVVLIIAVMSRGVWVNGWYAENMMDVPFNENGGAYVFWADDYALGIKECITNPLAVIKMLFYTVSVQGSFLLESMVCAPLGWLNIQIPAFISYIYLILIVVCSLKDESKKEIIMFRTVDKAAVWAAGIAIVGLCVAAMLLYWTPAGSQYVQGLQGRYFLPILPILCLSFRNNRIVVRRSIDKGAVIMTYMLQCIVVTYLLFV